VTAGSRSFSPVWCKGECPSDEYHFHGAAREIYSYLKVLAERHGGFVFPGISDITRHTKKWNKSRQPFSERQCKRILRMFRELKILGRRETRTIHGRRYKGWQMSKHSFWAELNGGICDFKHWGEFEPKLKACMGHKHKSNQQNVPDCVTSCVTSCVPQTRDCVTHCVTLSGDISSPKCDVGMELQTACES
jgi:hypothetical protein